MSGKTMIFTDVDFNRDGKQVDWLHLPHSVTRSAYGTIAMPIAVVKNGPGPTVLLMSGNHGDEYEGQIALAKLIRALEPDAIKGRVIILPAANYPAAMAGERVSPIDGGNLNRAFPGNADGTPTFAIAHYIDSVLYPMADYVHDLHSGGSSLEYMPFCSMRLSNDAGLDARAREALMAFNAPLGLVWAYSPDQRLSAVSSIKRGKVSLGGEFGGSGRVAIAGVAMVERGIRRLLAHAGVLPGGVPNDGAKPTRLVQLKGRDYYVYAPEPGLFEPFVELGAEVKKGDPCGQVHFIDNPARAPVPCFFRTSGMVICKRHFGRVERGDCVAHLATDVKG
jgi:predicted deacylase